MGLTLLAGSWVVISWVISKVKLELVTTSFRLLIALLISVCEPSTSSK